MAESATDVLPVDAAPLTSVILPRGMPPFRMASIAAIACSEEFGGLLDFERECGRHPVCEFGFDLEAECGCRHIKEDFRLIFVLPD
jgi:hypothetical protein